MSHLASNARRARTHRPSSVVHALVAFGLAVAAGHAAAQGLDPFGTERALRMRTTGLDDPLEKDCGIPGRALTLAMAVDLALCRNPTTRAAWAGAHEQAAMLGSAESERLPQLAASAATSHSTGQRINLLGNLGESAGQTSETAQLRWTLYDFGARAGHINRARFLLDAAAATAASTVQQTVLAVVRTYYGMAAAEANLAAARTTETATAQTLDLARARRNAGPGTLADELQAETARQQAALLRTQAEVAMQEARGTLAVTLGLTAGYPLTLDADAIPGEVPGVRAAMADLMDEALRHRPDLAAAQSRLEAANADVSVARASGRPILFLNAAGYDIHSTNVPGQRYGLVGVNLSIPLFTGFANTYGIRRATAARQASEAGLEDLKLTVSLDVWNAYYGLQAATSQLGSTASLTQAAGDNERVALSSYQGGVGRFLDVITAQSAAAQARQQRIGAEYNWRLARAQQALALGRLTSVEPLRDGSVLP